MIDELLEQSFLVFLNQRGVRYCDGGDSEIKSQSKKPLRVVGTLSQLYFWDLSANLANIFNLVIVRVYFNRNIKE